MKYCEKCGKEIMDESVVCPGCGCAVEKTATPQNGKTQNVHPKSIGWFIGGLSSLVIGVIIALFINVIVGAIFILVAELLFACARTQINKYAKSKNPSMNKKELKSAVKEIESKDGIAKVCHIMTIISFCILLPLVIFFW